MAKYIPYRRPKGFLFLVTIAGMASATYVMWPIIQKRNLEAAKRKEGVTLGSESKENR